ncbi:MAG: hypothetical protein ACE37D_15695 [Pseudomonadales bacterium]|jgi:hypothetical protein
MERTFANQDSKQPPEFRVKPNRRVNGQRRLQPDRRRAHVHVQNCRRKNLQDRRVASDRRPEQLTPSSETMISVPHKKRFTPLTTGVQTGRIINISV